MTIAKKFKRPANTFFIDSFTFMKKSKLHLFSFYLLLCLGFLSFSDLHAGTAELKCKITLLGGSMPANAILHSSADERFLATSNIDKDGNFSFTVDVPRATLFNIRFLNINYDVLLTAAEKTMTVAFKLDGNRLADVQVEKSPEDEAFKAFRNLNMSYDMKLRTHFINCEKTDSCERSLHGLLELYAEELADIQKKYKGTYTAEVLCKMKMPSLAKNPKNTSEEFRKAYFDNVDFSDSTIFATPVYRDMIGNYVDYLVEPSISKEKEFVKFFTEKISANPVVLSKSANVYFDELFRKQREKMLGMFIDWYNTGDNKARVNNPVMDVRLKNIAKVMPGQPYINAVGPDGEGTQRSLKDVVDKSKCTLLLFWSSECSHCREEMPLIVDMYEKYHSKGFDVFAISIEQDADKWKTFVKDKKLPWTNINAGRFADPNPAIQYVSVSTPTLVLIDSKGMILHRFISKTKLEKHIVEALK